MEYKWLGLQDYNTTFEEQMGSLTWVDQREEVWGLEHSAVITLGRRAQSDRDILSLGETRSIPIIHTDRGGLATVHNPGQLMIYPLLSLQTRGLGPRDYVCLLIQITQLTLKRLGLVTQCDTENSGLYVEGKKIVFIGLRIKEGRSYHGLSINTSNDLSLFRQILSCGLKERPITNIYNELHKKIPLEELFHLWCQSAIEFL